jgi:baseplate J-like protein
VQVVAIEPGSVANGLLGDAASFEALPFVANVTMTTAPDGGSEEETADDYLDRVVRTARRMKIVPVITDDYADQAIDNPSVERAVAVRLLNAEVYPATPNSPGHVTVFLADVNGQPVAAGVKTAVINDMMGTDRPLAVTVHAQDPTYTNLTIAVSIRLTLGADNPTTVQAVKDALTAAFSPANWRLDDLAPGRWRPPATTNERTLTAYDVAAVVDDVDGVAAVTAATVNGGASVVMSGWAPLPNLTATPTVTVVT